MKHNKRLLSILLAVMMVLGLAATAHADDAFVYTKTTKVQITKTLKIGQGITVPNETFKFTFTPATTAEATELGEDGTFIDPSKTQHGGVAYPNLNSVTITYNNNTRTKEGTDEELTFVSNEIDFNTLNVNWPEIGLYIYSVKETAENTTGMFYDQQKYFVKVYVKNASNGTAKEVDAVAVYGKNDSNEWVKVDGAPKTATETADDGCPDYVGNKFKFTNTYRKVVTQHPTNRNTTSGDNQNSAVSDYAFKLTKDVSGTFASQSNNFDFGLTVKLPDS